MTPLPETSWEGYIQHAKFWRNEVKRSLGESITNISLVTNPDGKVSIIGLATAPGDSSSNQMVMYADVPDGSENMEEDGERSILELKPLVDPQLAGLGSEQQAMARPTAELALHYERMRGQIVGGVTGYCVHAKSGAILISTPTQLTVFKDNTLKTIAQWKQPHAILNANFCESNPEYVAFTSHGQLYIDKDNKEVFSSGNDSSNRFETNGVASFVVQEEFERYDGYYWSPSRVELLYERVDESIVAQLPFTLPGVRAEMGEQPMRYPLAGTKNALCSPRICRLDEQSGQFVDLELDAELRYAVPWMEYVVRLGWTSDGNDVYFLLMDRVQCRMALALVPTTLFVESANLGKGVGEIQLIYEETSPFWINANNLLSFLPCQESTSFIIGSERSDLCHLYLQNAKKESKPITFGTDWAVLKEATIKVDTERGLLFYLANKQSPILLSLCVSSYLKSDSECRALTPADICYKFERSCPSLYLNPAIGFVCWLSSVVRLPECRFYRLVYNDSDPLPRAMFTHRIGVQVLPSSSGLNTSTWGMPSLHRPPSDIFSHRFFEFPSKNSGQNHYALLLWPTNASDGQKFPVIQAVYAGPSIQLVRNSWPVVSPYLKYVTFGYAVLLVDGRGSANRGVRFEGAIKQRLGTVEIADQVEGLRAVAEQSGGLLDMGRVSVIGWSYGGFASLLLLAEHPDIYRCACVGGAVSDWHLYDTAYTERYMGLPQKNEEAYKQSALASRVKQLPNQDGRLLIVHGMIDENVHFSQCSKLINALISAQKPHQLLLFPGERHAIRTGEAIEFFHASVLAFFAKALATDDGNGMM